MKMQQGRSDLYQEMQRREEVGEDVQILLREDVGENVQIPAAGLNLRAMRISPDLGSKVGSLCGIHVYDTYQ